MKYHTSVRAAVSALALSTGVALATVAIPANAQQLSGGEAAPMSVADVMVDDFIGTIRIREGRELSYSVDMGRDLVSAPKATKTGKKLIISGGQEDGPRRCKINDDQFEMKIPGGKMSPLSDFPVLTITAPKNSAVSVGLRSGKLEMEDAASLSMNFMGCGDAAFANVAGMLDVAILGSGDVVGESAGSASINILGSGDFEIEDVTSSMDISISGSGDVEVGTVAGPLSVNVRGSGDTEIERADTEISIDLKGSGDVSIDSGNVQNFNANVLGSGDVEFNGDANDFSVLLKGSGDVYVARLTGNRVVERHGSGDVRIGSWSSDDKE